MNKDKLEIDKNNVPFETRKNINLALNRDGCALVNTKWLVEENFERKEPTVENVMNSDYIYIADKRFLYQEEPRIIQKCNVRFRDILAYNEQSFYMPNVGINNIRVFYIDDYKKTWAFSPCDLEGSIWIR